MHNRGALGRSLHAASDPPRQAEVNDVEKEAHTLTKELEKNTAEAENEKGALLRELEQEDDKMPALAQELEDKQRREQMLEHDIEATESRERLMHQQLEVNARAEGELNASLQDAREQIELIETRLKVTLLLCLLAVILLSSTSSASSSPSPAGMASWHGRQRVLHFALQACHDVEGVTGGRSQGYFPAAPPRIDACHSQLPASPPSLPARSAPFSSLFGGVALGALLALLLRSPRGWRGLHHAA